MNDSNLKVMSINKTNIITNQDFIVVDGLVSMPDASIRVKILIILEKIR